MSTIHNIFVYMYMTTYIISNNYINITVLCNAMPCSLVDKYPRFSRKCFHLQDRRDSMFLKDWYLLTKLHNATSQMTLIFINTVVRTSNLTIIIFIQYLCFCVIFLSRRAIVCNRPVTSIISCKSLPG
jgi:hypothetical protein